MQGKKEQPQYGNWVSKQRIGQTLAMGVAFGLASAALFVFTQGAWLAAASVLALLTVFFIVAGVYFVWARWLFSDEGGGVQRKILQLVMDRVNWDGGGQAVDIGCGGGRLAILLAKKYSGARVTGVDYFGGSWGYGAGQCERNAQAEGVAGHTAFRQASASALPYEDGAFDLAVSNLVFHEVKDSADKRDVIKEALRVVKPGGWFVFQDLLKLKPYFGKPDELVALIKSWGVREVRFEDTSGAEFIPRALKLPFMVGALGIVYGVK